VTAQSLVSSQPLKNQVYLLIWKMTVQCVSYDVFFVESLV